MNSTEKAKARQRQAMHAKRRAGIARKQAATFKDGQGKARKLARLRQAEEQK